MRSVALSLAVLVMLGVARTQAGETTRGVQCSCDPPGTYRPPGSDCAALCAPSTRPAAGAAAAPAMSLEQQAVGVMLGSFLQGLTQPSVRSGPTPAQRAAEANREAEIQRRRIQEGFAQKERRRRERERARFAEDKAESETLLKGSEAAASLELKDEESVSGAWDQEKPLEPGLSVLDEALELLRRAKESDRRAVRALSME